MLFRGSLRQHVLPLICLAAFTAAACSSPVPAPVPPANEIDPTQPGGVAASAMTGVVVLGDSLTAGLGLVEEESFPSRLQVLFMEEGYHEVEIMNRGVSGDTTAGGLRRVDEVLGPDVKVAVVALGGNDALRGISVTETKANLKAIIEKFLDARVSVLLAGMEGPTNLGEDYRTNFRNTFQELAMEYRGRIRFVPFLLEGVAGMPALNQPDGIHPNAEGAQKVAELLYPNVRDLVDEIPAGPVTQ
jgi:acyl-CoA thioesterase-1